MRHLPPYLEHDIKALEIWQDSLPGQHVGPARLRGIRSSADAAIQAAFKAGFNAGFGITCEGLNGEVVCDWLIQERSTEENMDDYPKLVAVRDKLAEEYKG